MTGLSYKSLAALLEIRNPRAISRWEKGFTMPAPVHLLKMSYLFRTQPQQLYSLYYSELVEQVQKRISRMHLQLNIFPYRSINDN